MRKIVAAMVLLAFPGAAPAAAQQVAISEQDCRQLVAHNPAPDVTYTPGVDVYGRAVAPADLTPPQVQMPQTYVFDVYADLRKYGVRNDSRLLLPAVGVGQITIADQGQRVYFNGQPIGDTEQKALAEACRQRGLRR
ncbi:MAG TPA: hypothetical protein VGB82_05360 [Alphaproteobacteria bacterium]